MPTTIRAISEHPRAQVATALRKIKERAAKLKISKWIIVTAKERKIIIQVDEVALVEESKIDG